MTTAEARARGEILEAAARLTREGLIQRTWGNISARVSETEMLITPSGLAYDTLREDQLVLINLRDGSCIGCAEPSSERGIHADAYRLRPETNFVIHTHQYWASVIGTSGAALTGFIHPLIGKRVPCAAYGLPGTRRLRRAVEAEILAWPDCRVFLLRSHGALCLGRDLEDAFAAARALEEVCGARVRDLTGGAAASPSLLHLGVSRRQGDRFCLEANGASQFYPVRGGPLPPIAALHAAVYRAGNFRCAACEDSTEVRAVSGRGRTLRPYVDDLAQIAGTDIRCVPADPRAVERAMRGRNAVLLRGTGALCAGETEEDVQAVCALLRKGCAAALYAREDPRCRPLSPADARIQRLLFQRSYAKKRSSR